jgi:hypothetical protein
MGSKHTREVRGAAGSSDDDAETPLASGAAILGHIVGGPVRRDDPDLVCHLEVFADIRRSPHRC